LPRIGRILTPVVHKPKKYFMLNLPGARKKAAWAKKYIETGGVLINHAKNL
jgi:hypothetical protein